MHYLTALLTLLLPILAFGSAESENEPARNQMDILVKAISNLPNTGVHELTPKYNKKENTGYYIREAKFIGRVATPKGHRIVMRFMFIRSSTYGDIDNSTPPRGHTFIVVFDDSLQYITHKRIEFTSKLSIEDTKLMINRVIQMDLGSLKLPTKSKQ